MLTLKQPSKQFYTEQEAAAALGVSVPTLHAIVDRYIFNNGTPRPEVMEFQTADLLLIAYFMEEAPESKVVSISR